MVNRSMVKCDTCHGSGEVHRHNPKCWDCDGKGVVKQVANEQVVTCVAPFSYRDATAPDGYICGDCNATGVRLYREYQTFLEHQKLRCRHCAMKNQFRTYADGPKEHSIGWLVAAVPTEDGTGYWGFSSVPDEGVSWWERLPNKGLVTAMHDPLPLVMEILPRLLETGCQIKKQEGAWHIFDDGGEGVVSGITFEVMCEQLVKVDIDEHEKRYDEKCRQFMERSKGIDTRGW